MGAVCMALEQTNLGTGIRYEDIQALNLYWSQVRMLYSCFEGNVRASDSSVFDHEMPGGQYTNLMVCLYLQCLSPRLRSSNFTVPSTTTRSRHSVDRYNNRTHALVNFLITFLTVIKQKYIEANDLVGLLTPTYI